MGPQVLGLRPRLGETGLTGLNRRGDGTRAWARFFATALALFGENGPLRLRPEGPVSQSQGR